MPRRGTVTVSVVAREDGEGEDDWTLTEDFRARCALMCPNVAEQNFGTHRNAKEEKGMSLEVVPKNGYVVAVAKEGRRGRERTPAHVAHKRLCRHLSVRGCGCRHGNRKRAQWEHWPSRGAYAAISTAPAAPHLRHAR